MKLRLHKYMSDQGVASRRKSEELITQGVVYVNAKKAQIGQIIDSQLDKVEVKGKHIKPTVEHVIYLINKPRQVVSTTTDPEGRRTITSFIKSSKRLFPVGRLDYDSEGLMLLTNNGDLANKLTHPKYEIDKTYRVLVRGVMTNKAMAYLESGVVIEGKKTSKARVVLVEKQLKNTWIDITIHEGRNRQIRKMCETVSYPVLRLIRTHLGSWDLGDLKPGQYKEVIPSVDT